MRLIDADALKIENVDLEHGCTVVDYAMAVIKSVADATTIDAVPVVRCCECKYWQDNNGGYPHNECRWGKDETPNPDDFCSYGERKEADSK